MAEPRKVKTRIINKHATAATWEPTGTTLNFTPLQGEIIIYDQDETHPKPRLKIGDGGKTVDKLPFFGSHSSQYAECSTGGAQSVKEIVIPDFVLETGATILVKFLNTNSASDVYLRVNPSEKETAPIQHQIYYRGASISSDMIMANCLYQLVFDNKYGLWYIQGTITDDIEELNETDMEEVFKIFNETQTVEE